MSRKKILIADPIALFPKVMASQDRVINMIKRLSQDHDVDLVTITRNKHAIDETKRNLGLFYKNFYSLPPINPKNNWWKRKITGLQFLYKKYTHFITSDYFYSAHPSYIKQLSEIINGEKYDILQIEYWFQGEIFSQLKDSVFKVVDTHDVLYDKRRQSFLHNSGGKLNWFQQKVIDKYEKLETTSYRNADLLISITSIDSNVLKSICPHKKNIVIPTGQDIEYFSNFQIAQEENTILFYGSMGGQENIDAFFRFYQNILPLVKKKIADVKVIVVGANPPESVKSLATDKLIVTGFVEDVRHYVGKAKVMVIPLDIAGGFRSRTVDVMAMGVPVVGTHNALDNVELIHGKHGFISDSDEKMAEFVILLLTNDELQLSMNEECKKFAAEKYSIEATYGKLSDYYLNL